MSVIARSECIFWAGLKCSIYSTSKMSKVINVSWFVVSIPEGKPDICWAQLNSISEHKCYSLSGWTLCLDTISRFINTCLWWVNLTTARLVCLQVIPFKGNFYRQMFQPNAGLPRKRQGKESILPVKQQGFKPGLLVHSQMLYLLGYKSHMA